MKVLILNFLFKKKKSLKTGHTDGKGQIKDVSEICCIIAI